MMDLSSIEGAIAGIEGRIAGVIGPIDLVKVEQIVMAIVQAAPAIQAAEQSMLPFIEAIVGLIQNGGKAPSDEEWALLRSRLDAGSKTLQDAAKEPDPNEPGQGAGS